MSVVNSKKLFTKILDRIKLRDAASGGTDPSIVTTGEKYTWNQKVDPVSGKGLSTEDYTTEEKTKLSGIATGATNVEIDNTLTTTGKAADAKKVGDEVSNLKENLSDIEDNVELVTSVEFISFSPKQYIATSSYSVGDTVSLTPSSNNAFSYAIVDCQEGDLFTINATGWTTARLWAFIDSNNKLISKSDGSISLSNYVLCAPANANKLILNSYTSSLGTCFKGISEKHKEEYLYDTISEFVNDIPLQSGYINTSGNIISASTRMTTGIIPNTGNIVVTANSFYGVSLMAGNEKKNLTEIGNLIPTSNHGGKAVYVKRNERYLAFNISKLSTVESGIFTNEDIIGFKLFPSHCSWTTHLVAKRAKIDQFYNSKTISDVQYTHAYSDGFDINDSGDVCVGMGLSDRGTSESSDLQTTCFFAMFNLANVEDTIVTKPIFDGNRCSNPIAKYVGSDIVIIGKTEWIDNGGQNKHSGFAAQVYDVETETLSALEKCMLTVGLDEYQMNMEHIKNGDSWVPGGTQTEIEEIWSNTGIEHPTGYGGTPVYNYYFCGNPFKYNNVFYCAISIGNQSHALCQSSDMIHWEFVCDIPFGQASEEVSLCIYKGNIYATSRGNYSVDQKWSQVIMCDMTELDGNHWSIPVVMHSCKQERPTIAAMNDKIYIMQGKEQATENGLTVPRGLKVVAVYDLSLNLLNWSELSFDYPLLQPQFMVHDASLFVMLSSDKRNFAFVQDSQGHLGNGRSEISFTRLDQFYFDV